eukprot:8899010-Prorocentrum_lima.AAC.1
MRPRVPEQGRARHEAVPLAAMHGHVTERGIRRALPHEIAPSIPRDRASWPIVVTRDDLVFLDGLVDLLEKLAGQVLPLADLLAIVGVRPLEICERHSPLGLDVRVVE